MSSQDEQAIRIERANTWITAYGLLERSDLRHQMTPDDVLELARFLADLD